MPDLDAPRYAIPCLDAQGELTGRTLVCGDRQRIVTTLCRGEPCDLVGTLHESFCSACGFLHDQTTDFATYCYGVFAPHAGRTYHFAAEGIVGRGPYLLPGLAYAKVFSDSEEQSVVLGMAEGVLVGESTCESDPYSMEATLPIEPWWHHVFLYTETGCILQAYAGRTSLRVTRSEVE